MELEEMKALWAQQQAVAEDNRKTNELLIRQITAHRNRDRISKMLSFEYFSLGGSVLLLLILLLNIRHLPFSTEMCISVPFCILSLLAAIGWGIYKIRHFREIDIAGHPVTESMARISRLRLLFVKEYRWSAVLLPFLFFSFFSVVFMMLRGTSILEYISGYLVNVAIALVVAWATLWYIYLRIYQPVFRQIQDDVAALRDFKGEK